MNKLLVIEEKKNINSGEYILDYEQDLTMTIDGDAILHNYSENSKTLSIDMKNQSKLCFYKANVLTKDFNIVINMGDACTLDYRMVIINSGNIKVKIQINMLGNGGNATIHLRTINMTKDSSINIICNGHVLENSRDNELLEDLKGLILDMDSIKISPNMMVDSNEVMANHLVTIGSFNREDLFYLKSRGLSENTARRLLMESFVTNIMSDYEKEKIKMEVKNIE